MVGVVLAIGALGVMLEVDVRRATVAYVVLSAAALWTTWPHMSSTTDLAFFALIAVLKLIAGPAMLLTLVRRYGARADLAPSFGFAWRVFAAAVVLVAAHAASMMSAFAHVPHAAAVFTAVLASIVVVIANRSLLAHALGLLALGSAIGLASATFAPQLPIAVELGDAFDVILATFVAFAIARAVIVHDPALDIRSMRRLRG
ncbi:MAG: hypothetical protein KGN02_10345 [bacterium]|nr:hypothetical protein [bacterium]